jgi:Domain of unknown function (DUF4336)
MTTLARWEDGVWIASSPHTMLGLHLGTRMTVVRLPSGALLLHSPVAPDEQLRREIDALGPVGHIVASNVYHHVYAGAMHKAYPQAVLHAPAALRKKRRDLRIDADLGDVAPLEWGSALIPVTIEGCMLRETVFVHAASRTVISSDLAENFATSEHGLTRLYLKIAGVHGRVGWSRLLRFLYRDKAAARRSIDRLLTYDFDHLILAHGEPIRTDAKDAIRNTFSFLDG